ncbi:MAG: GNAT family N-acetyltransferase [bacterium]
MAGCPAGTSAPSSAPDPLVISLFDFSALALAIHLDDLPLEDAAYDAVVALNRLAGANAHIRGVVQRARDDARRPYGEVVRLVARQDGQLVGHAGAFPLIAYAGPGRRYVQLAVHPAWRGRGVGRRLLDALLARLPGARELIGQLDAQDARTRRFLEAAVPGEIASEDLELALEVPALDAAHLARLRGYADRLPALGLRVAPLAALKAVVPDWLPRLHHLATGLDEDVPSPVAHDAPGLEPWAAAEIRVPDVHHEALFLALDGDRWVGLCELRAPGAPGCLVHDLTGVVRPWRRRGVALGLKAAAALWARSAGVERITTWTHVENAAMRATNAHIGFEERRRWHLWVSERADDAPGR